jgi:chemotaxis protein MotB
MTDSGLRKDQVAEVRGYADQRLRKPEDPNDASNRRVSIVVKYLNAPPETAPPTKAPPEKVPPTKQASAKH